MNLKGVVIGNGVCHCSGDHCYGDDHSYQLYKLLYGHGMISTETFMSIWEGCGYQDVYHGGAGNYTSTECRAATAQANTEHGSFNVVNVYDNCPPFKQREVAKFYENTGL